MYKLILLCLVVNNYTTKEELLIQKVDELKSELDATKQNGKLDDFINIIVV